MAVEHVMAPATAYEPPETITHWIVLKRVLEHQSWTCDGIKLTQDEAIAECVKVRTMDNVLHDMVRMVPVDLPVKLD